ncbi:Serine protease inhibitor 3/4 [Papilio xuthus]|uniref:Serine protease inhibitor 3/4 n=1 Tax=Papilio xuthus TaxID=66420 RepID=A0A194PXB8_PAPXU|nr:Serine protease inhibitor 3/4 [Papilio xuthus]
MSMGVVDHLGVPAASCLLHFKKKYLKTHENPVQSFVASPFSVLFPLAELTLYASGTAYDQLSNILNIDNRNEIRQGFRNLLDNFESSNNVTITLAQKVFGSLVFQFIEDFKYDTKEYFDAEAQNLDFSQSEEAAGIINDWVNTKTSGKIPELVKSNMLNSLTQMVLVNAIYFKGNWQTPFDPVDTKPDDFYVSKDEKITVNMMFQEGLFHYAENDALQIKGLELKYEDEDYSLLIVLPTSDDDYSVESLVQKMQDSNVFNGIINDLSLEGVRVHLPSIETTTTTDLKQILQGVNVTEIFNPDTTDLSGVLEYLQPLYVTVAIQKAVLVINELGTEVSVANAVITSLRMGPVGDIVFNANRPFLYYVLYKRNVMFCGTYTGK